MENDSLLDILQKAGAILDSFNDAMRYAYKSDDATGADREAIRGVHVEYARLLETFDALYIAVEERD